MKLWLLRPAENIAPKNHPWNPWYDKAFGFVVRAEDEKQARKMVQGSSGMEVTSTVNPWTNSKYSTCVELTTDGQPEVIITDFAAA